jgi:uncharacterized protein RhaS with RHS repeats
LSAVRFGDSCATEKFYNWTTGGCGNDEQKGQPKSSCPTGLAGNPINTAIGNKIQSEVDYQFGNFSVLGFVRTYNSLDGVWRHNHSTHLRLAGDNISLVMANGREIFFKMIGSEITAKPSELGRLIKLTSGWTYTDEKNQIFTFNSSGLLINWSNGLGSVHQLTYSGNQVTVTDNFNRTLTFAEDAQHQPLSMTAGGVQISYGYNPSKRLIQLTRVRGGTSEQRKFHYEDPRNSALLTGITDEMGIRYASWSYDDKGRAISSEHAGGVEFTLVSYNSDGSAIVTNELGKKTTYRFQVIQGVKRVTAIEGEPSPNCPNSNSTFTYDERGLLKTKTDNRSLVTTYDYNARGLEISRTEAVGTLQARTITTDWHPTLFLPLSVTESNRITTYQYDAQGRQLSQTITDR